MGYCTQQCSFSFSILWFMVPGYFIALVLTFFVPKSFTAIAFDSGGDISFIIPLCSIGGKKALQFLIENQDYQKEEESSLKNTTHELIIVIAEQGYTGLIMDAAREAGAYGGTVIHAKGTGMEFAEKFMHMSLAAEKEIIFIVTKTEQKNPIMQKAGADSKAKAITFSLPVSATAGLRLIED